MSNVKFSQLPNLGNITANTIVPVVAAGTNYTVTAANLQSYVNSSTGNITGGNINSPTLNNGANINVVANAQSWTFDSTGNLGLPGGGIIYGNPYTPSGSPGNTITLQPAGSGITTGQKLLVYPTAGDGDHIHLASGNLYQTELFLGSDNLYVKLANTGNVVINSNDNNANSAMWTFDTTGNLTIPSNLVIGPGSGGGSSILQYDAALQILGEGANSVVTMGWTANQSAPDSVTTIAMNYPGGGEGNVLIAVGNNATTVNYWLFDNTGNLRLPGNTFAVKYANGTAVSLGGSYGNANVVANLAALGSNPVSTTGNVTGGNLLFGSGVITGTGNVTGGNILTGGLISATGNITANVGSFFIGNGSQLTGIAASYGNANVVANLAALGSNPVSTTGNVTGGNLLTGGLISATSTITGTSHLGSVVSVTGNVTGGNILTGGVISSTGNITGGNISATNHTGTTVSVTGNITAANFFGNGNTLSNVATRFEGAWTVPTGNSTQSFTVASGTYQLWVDCNIPNGILAWNATATITNTNVPVVGVQYAWVYTGGPTPIDFTSIPNQFIGTANTIVRNSTAPSATTNRFDFGINNTSGGNVTVRYGWITIS